MNRGLYTVMGVLTAIKSVAGDIFSVPGVRPGRTPGIPSRRRGHRNRPHAPNDGRRHMKFHRNRHRH